MPRKTRKNSRKRKVNKKIKQTRSQRIKSMARKTLNKKMDKRKKNYVVDTSVIINKFIPGLIEKGLKGRIIIPDAVIAELENLANKGREEGFVGLDEITKLQKFKKSRKINLNFAGPRPDIKHIRYAKSGEIDALIRNIAFKNKATLITADLIQAKSAQAYGIRVLFLRPKIIPKKKKGIFSFLKRKNRESK